MGSSADRIEKRTFLRAPQERVWRAIADARAFGSWFGMELDGSFASGAHLTGRITPTTVDPAVAKRQEPHAGTRFALTVERIEPMRKLAFRWRPEAVEGVATLVTFTLQPAEGGTNLAVVESGFAALPPERRPASLERNEEGWSLQLQLIEKYLQQSRS